MLTILGAANATAAQPSFIFVLTDDQDLLLDSMEAMPFTRSLLPKAGATLERFHAHTPVCCPSRSELLSGRYFHNLKLAHAADDHMSCMHVNADDNFQEHLVFARALNDSGYMAGYFGKYMNAGGMKHVCPEKAGKPAKLAPPKGWDADGGWLVMCPDTCYTDCAFGTPTGLRTFDDPTFANGSNYATSVIGNATLAWVRSRLAAGSPFIAFAATHAPHGPATPAAWYAHTTFGNVSGVPRTPAFNYKTSNHYWMVDTQPAVTSEMEVYLDGFYLDRWRTLLSVDDIVREAHAAVHDAGRMDTTYFVYTCAQRESNPQPPGPARPACWSGDWHFAPRRSDHGLHMGQHRLGACKRTPYDVDVRIPFYIAGPGIAPGGRFDFMASMVDIAPTLIDLAGASAAAKKRGLEFDGRSMAPLLRGGSTAWRDAVLVEYAATEAAGKVNADHYGHIKDVSNNTFAGLRLRNATADLAYFETFDAFADWNMTRTPMARP